MLCFCSAIPNSCETSHARLRCTTVRSFPPPMNARVFRDRMPVAHWVCKPPLIPFAAGRCLFGRWNQMLKRFQERLPTCCRPRIVCGGLQDRLGVVRVV